MADLKTPNLNRNSNKFLFKKKLSLRRKSKRKLIKESFFMLSFSFLIIYLNYIIPNKIIVFKRFLNNLGKVMANFLDSIYYSYEIGLVVFIIVSLIFALILMLGAFARIMKMLKRKSRQITFK